MIWEKSGDAYYAVAADIGSRPIARLIAEPRLGGGWDWAAWAVWAVWAVWAKRTERDSASGARDHASGSAGGRDGCGMRSRACLISWMESFGIGQLFGGCALADIVCNKFAINRIDALRRT
jgi:hypothetical protein